MEKIQNQQKKVTSSKPHNFLVELEKIVRPDAPDVGLWGNKPDLETEWKEIDVWSDFDFSKAEERYKKIGDRRTNYSSFGHYFLYDKKRIFNTAFSSVYIKENYTGVYKQDIKTYDSKAYNAQDRKFAIYQKDFEKRYIARASMWLAYAMTLADLDKRKTCYVSDLVRKCLDTLHIPLCVSDKFLYKPNDDESASNIFLLVLAAALRVLFDAKRENGIEAPSSDNNEDILWFLEKYNISPENQPSVVTNLTSYTPEEYGFVEEKIIRHIWTTNRLIFDNHSKIARREGIILSDYYVVPALSCLNDKACEFILDRTEGMPIRARLCAPSGFGKSTLFLAILYCSTLDKAVEYGIVSPEEERSYRILQKELIGENKNFPQFLPVVITGSEFSGKKSNDFVDLFAQIIFPIDDITPENEIENKKKWQNTLKEMLESRADQVLFFCDAFDECDSEHRARYGEKFRKISENPKGYNILLSYRPFCDEDQIKWKECKQWTILPLTSWGIDKETNRDKTWLMIRKTTDSIHYFDKDESERCTNLIYDQMNTSPFLKEFSASPYLMSEYVSLRLSSKGEYLEKTVYEMVRDMVSRIFERYNPDNDCKLTREEFKEVCGGIALNQIQKDPYSIMLANISDVFCNVVNKKYPSILKYFSTMIACEDINSKSGVLILNDDNSGYIFQANAITMPYLASLEFFSIIYKILQDAIASSEDEDYVEREILYKLRQVLEWIHDDHYIFVPLLIARICDRNGGSVIFRSQQNRICQLILDCAKSLDIPDMMNTLRDRSFAKTVFSD